MNNILIFGLCLMPHVLVTYSKFYSGTFSWMKDERTDQVRLVYRMSWQKGTGPCGVTCSPNDDGKNTSITDPSLAGLSFRNNGTSLGDVHYVITDVSETNTSGWEQGESFYYFTPVSNKSIVYIQNIPWINSGQSNMTDFGFLQTTIDIRDRNDTNRSNISPFASVPPYLGVKYGCTKTVRIPTFDPDGDRVACRWARTSECKGACTNVPLQSVYLDEPSCSLTIDADTAGSLRAGTFYRLAIVIEDFPDDIVAVGSEIYDRQKAFSQIPYQVSLWVSAVNIQCGLNNMTFVMATPTNFVSLQLTTTEVRLHKSFNTSFYVQTDNPGVLNFIVSGPRGLESEIVPDDLSVPLNRTDVVKLSVGWRPDYRTQAGGSQICVWGIDVPYGLTTEVHCITLYSSDYNQCSTTLCKNNGTCKNIYGSTEKCTCKPGYKSRTCAIELKCHDKPCLNSGTCSEDPVSGYTCHCSSGYTGKNCEVANVTGIMNNITSYVTHVPDVTNVTVMLNNLTSNDTQFHDMDFLEEKTNKALLWEILGAILGFILLVLIALVIYKISQKKVRPINEMDKQQ